MLGLVIPSASLAFLFCIVAMFPAGVVAGDPNARILLSPALSRSAADL